MPAVPAVPAVPQSPVRTSVVVDSNPALFAVLSALNAAGYDRGLPPLSADGKLPASATPADKLRLQIRDAMGAQRPAVLADLRAYYTAHRLRDANQDLAQYITLALFLGNPPALTLTVPVAGLPPDAAGVSDVLPLVRQFWQQAGMDAIWDKAQPDITLALSQDTSAARKMLSSVNAFFRIPQEYSPRQFFIYPAAMMSAGQSAALNYEDNYYIAVNLALEPQMDQIRHTYLHFLLDPLIAQFPAAFVPVEQQILPLVANAPALDMQFKRDPELLYTECLVRAVEIELDPGTLEQKQAAVAAALSQGLVVTGLWYDQLQLYKKDPANFTAFYPEAAFAMRIDDLAGQVKHIAFAPAPAAASATVQPVHALGLLDQAQTRYDAHDLAGAQTLAQAALQQPAADLGPVYFLLGKIAAAQNQPPLAMANFENAVAKARATDTHVRTWSNIFLARLYDAENNRLQAVSHYKAALASADTDDSKAIAQNGIKQPFRPPVRH